MLNSSENEILRVLKDAEYLQFINVSIDDIEKAIKLRRGYIYEKGI